MSIISEKRGNSTDEMATSKGAETEYSVRKGEKTSDGTGSRRALKFKAIEQTEGLQKKQTRAKTRTIVLDDALPAQSSVNKAREKGRAVVELIKIVDGPMISKKEVENTVAPKKDIEIVGIPKKNVIGTVAPKKEIIGTGSLKKDIIASVTVKKEAIASGQSKKDGESTGPPKKDIQSLTVSKKEIETITVKSRKLKVKVSNNVAEKKRDDRLIPLKPDEIKSDVTTSEKSKNKDEKLKADRKENGTTSKLDNERNREIMNSHVTSSVEEKPPRPVRNHSPATAVAGITKESMWTPGDLAWGRVGQHPFWPCIIAIDHLTGIFTKTRRVGRGLNSVQQSVHVQFYGDNGRHSWIPSTCVIKYEGQEKFQKFAEKVLREMKKRDRKGLSAFVVKPSSRNKWEVAIREAEESVSKGREERIQFFEDLRPKRRRLTVKANPGPKTTTNETKSSVQLVKKRNKRPNPILVEKPSKQMKMSRQLKAQEAKKKIERSMPNEPARKKRGRSKVIKKRTGILGK